MINLIEHANKQDEAIFATIESLKNHMRFLALHDQPSSFRNPVRNTLGTNHPPLTNQSLTSPLSQSEGEDYMGILHFSIHKLMKKFF